VEQPNYEGFCGDVTFVFDVDGSVVADPPLPPPPPVSKEKQEFLDAIKQFQRKYTGRSLSWGEIFDVLVSLGYRKIEQAAAPPGANGGPQEDARADDPKTEKPL
jgi:hypothetical protein